MRAIRHASRRWALALALALAAAAPATAAEETPPGQRALFESDHLAAIEGPTTLVYDFRVQGELVDSEVLDDVELRVLEILPDGRKAIAFRLFHGPDLREFGPTLARRGNPLVMVFLQRDVETMGRITGVSPQYLRNRIRAAFRDDSTAAPVRFSLDGREHQGLRVTIRPYADDAGVERYGEFQHKEYEFVVSPEIPGGVYRLAARTLSAPGGDTLIEEALTYRARRPPTTGEQGG